MALTRVAPAGIGSTPGTGYVIGDSFLHATGLNATNGYYTGIVTAQTFRVLGNFQVDGTTTTLDTEITSVDKLEVAANNNTVGVAITQSGTGDILRLYDGSSQVVTVDDEGQIGIGANAPSANLDIAETGFVNVKIRTSGTNSATLNLQNSQRNYSVNTIPGGAFSIHDSTANLSRLRIESGGNVGINTNAPSAPLTVYSRSDGASVNTNPGSDTNTFQINRATSTLLFNGTGTSKISKGGHSPGNLQIESQNSNIEFLAGGSERLRIKSNGNIGIGTNNPEQNLHIQDASEPTVSFWTGSTKRSAFQGQSTGTYIYSYQGQPLLFSVGSGNSFSEKVRITSTGSFGIGTTDPVSKLHLADNVNTTNNILTIQGTSWGDGEKVFTTYKRGSVHLGRFGVEADGAGQAGQLIFECGNGGSPVERLRITSGGDLGLGVNGGMNQAGTLYIQAGQGVRWTHTSNGTLYGDHYVSDAGNHVFRTGSVLTERLRIASDGQMILGTASNLGSVPPKLTIVNNTNSSTFSECQLLRLNGPSGVGERGGIGFHYAQSLDYGEKPSSFIGVETVAAGGAQQTDLLFATRPNTTDSEPSERLRITSGGRIGIGTDNPDQQVEINGNVKFTKGTSTEGSQMLVLPLEDITLASNASASIPVGSRFTGLIIVAGYTNDTAAGVWAVASASSYSLDAVTRIQFNNHPASNTSDLTITSPSHGGTHQFQLNQTGSSTKTYKVFAMGIYG